MLAARRHRSVKQVGLLGHDDVEVRPEAEAAASASSSKDEWLPYNVGDHF
jgi:hypothetical protein